MELQPARHERPRPAGRRRARLRARGVGPLHQHQRSHPQRNRPGAALPDAVSQRGGGPGQRNRARPGLCVRPDPPGIALRDGCALACRRLGTDAGDAGHCALDGQADRHAVHARHAHRSRRQPEDRHRLPEARARRLRRFAGDGCGRLQRRPEPAAALARRGAARAGDLGREHPVQRDARLRQEGAVQRHRVRRDVGRARAGRRAAADNVSGVSGGAGRIGSVGHAGGTSRRGSSVSGLGSGSSPTRRADHSGARAAAVAEGPAGWRRSARARSGAAPPDKELP